MSARLSALQKKFTTVVAIGGAGLLLLGAGCNWAGLRVNTTKSIPIGIYRTSDAPVSKDSYVMFCPPHTALFDEAKERGYIGAGFCPGGYGYMMKKVYASSGDLVQISDEGVVINGETIPLSKPLSQDAAGRPMPVLNKTFRLENGELLLMSDISKTSFDGRYFGPVPAKQVKSALRAVMIW